MLHQQQIVVNKRDCMVFLWMLKHQTSRSGCQREGLTLLPNLRIIQDFYHAFNAVVVHEF